MAALLERAARGDAAAFDLLIRPRLDRLFRMAVAITRNEVDARDAVQDACVLAWRELPRLRDPARFDAWLSQILVNACRGLLRAPAPHAGPRDRDRCRARRGRRPRGVLHGRPKRAVGEIEAIRAAFGLLDPDVRALLVLHYVEERPLAEIGRMLGTPVGTVKWRLSNARKALDRALEGQRS